MSRNIYGLRCAVAVYKNNAACAALVVSNVAAGSEVFALAVEVVVELVNFYNLFVEAACVVYITDITGSVALSTGKVQRGSLIS